VAFPATLKEYEMLAERRTAARDRKLAGLEQEFASWETASGQNGEFRLHHSQIGRILSVLRPLRSHIANSPAAPVAARSLSDREIETTALELHRIWEFFRSKFAMRTVRWLKSYLDAVDDFAWACYKPARDAAEAAGTLGAEALKEPPLLFFGGGWSPFAMPRNYPFDAERVPQEPVRTQAFVQALKKLPVPVVGIPWFQVRHLPDAVVIGHEVGHIVEDDLGLTTTILAAMASAPAKRRDAWQAWGGEIFGDLYGQLATGPAFVSALAEVLGDGPAEIVAETAKGPTWGAYPPTYLRMNVNFAMLRALGFTAAADRLEAEWTASYGATHAMAVFDADVATVTKQLVDAKHAVLGGLAIGDVLSFKALQDEADVAFDALSRGAAPSAGNVRALVAASQMHFAATPAGYTEAVQQRVLDTIALSLPPGVRGSVETAQVDAAGKQSEELISLLAGRTAIDRKRD
jgi:hypothetical protein